MSNLRVCDICSTPLKGDAEKPYSEWRRAEREADRNYRKSITDILYGKEEIPPDLCNTCKKELVMLYVKWKKRRIETVTKFEDVLKA